MIRPRSVAKATALSATLRRYIASKPDLSPFKRWKTARVVQDQLHERQDQTPEVGGEIRGWVQSVRASKTIKFIDVVDGSRMGATQVTVSTQEPQLEELVSKITPGSAVHFKGSYVPSRKQAQEWGPSPGTTVKSRFDFNANSGEVVGDCDSKTLPVQNKYQTPQFLRTIPHLRARAPLYGELVRLRSDMIRAFTNYFADAEFAQVHPPIITSSDCEGAGEAFTIHPAFSSSKPSPSAPEAGTEYFGAPKYLTVSSQLHLEAMAQGLGAVWALSPVFRAEDSDTGRHLSEFYMLEAELAFADNLDTVMNLAESCLSSVTRRLEKTSGEAWLDRPWEGESNARSLVGPEGSTAILPKEVAALRWQGMTQTKKPWPRITYTEAIKLLSKHKDKFKFPPTWGAELQTEHEKFLALEVGGADTTSLGHMPVFVTHYPRDTKAFYMAASPSSSDTEGPTVACFDLLLPGAGELVGGSLREHRLEPLLQSMTRCGISPGPAMDWYLDLRRWGCPPHGGFGIGFDRLLSWLAAMSNIRDTATFPRWPGRCDC